jgi:hypothetical protein
VFYLAVLAKLLNLGSLKVSMQQFP